VYSKRMEIAPTKRKRRTDRNHIIYLLTCASGDKYVGITVARGRAYQRSLEIRWQGHVYHATVENRPYPIAKAIREHGPDQFSREVLQIVRGKSAAHSLERTYIENIQPSLNVVLTGRKRAARAAT